MACEHRRLKSVNCVIMCADCGAVVETPKPKADKPARKAAKKGEKENDSRHR